MTIDLTPQEEKKLLRLAKIADNGELAIIEEINNLEDRIDELTITQKGEAGYTPVKGVDYFDGEDGYTPKKGVDYFDGKTPTNRELISLIEPLIPEAPRASDIASTAAKMALDEIIPQIPVIDTASEIRDKLKSLKGEERLDKSAIKGLEEWLRDVADKFKGNNIVAGGVRLFRQLRDTPYSYAGQAGKVVTVNADEDGLEFTNSGLVNSVTGLNTDNSDPANPIVQISVDGSTITGTGTPGDPLVATTGGTLTVYTETPTGDIDGVNVSYTTAQTINTVLNFAINGDYIHPEEYSAVGTSITFTTPLAADLAGKYFTITFI